MSDDNKLGNKIHTLREAHGLSIEDLAELIYDLQCANEQAKITVKLVSSTGVGTIASGVAKAGAGGILISGGEGGTGAAPMSSVHHAGLPWELGVSEAHQSLIENGLRERVVLETDGKLMSGRDVAIAALLGAEEFGFATAPLVSIGCMMMRVCSKDTCPVGIATQNEKLRGCFHGKPEYVMCFMRFVAEELREIMASLGFRTVDEMVGRTDCLKKKEKFEAPRAVLSDLNTILNPGFAKAKDLHFDETKVYDFQLEKSKDEAVLLPAFAGKKAGSVDVEVSSTDRAFGTILGSRITRVYGDTLAEDSFVVNGHGGGGQSFGAFLPKGLTIRLEGDANDGFGKGLSGGKLVVVPPKQAGYNAHENVIIGNVALYGATSGTVYINGIAGERFMVRNSGAIAVCEGCGDHGLEYMTGGRAVILGTTGKNFAAGMSGGIAYVLDREHTLYLRMNKDMASFEELSGKNDIEELKEILEDYENNTGSKKAREILDDFENRVSDFKKVIPFDYRNVLILIGKYEEQGIRHEQAVYEAFKEISR